MGYNCSVYGCKSDSKNKNFNFHRFPRDDRRQSWINACQRPDLNDRSTEQLYNKFVCSLHFERWMYMNTKLKDSAIPILNLPSASLYPMSTQTEVPKIEIIKDSTTRGVQQEVDVTSTGVGKMIQQRWKTARDAYIRSKNHQKKGINKKFYGFSDELRFLDKIEQNQNEADSSNETATPNFVECVYENSHTLNAPVEVKVEPHEFDSSNPSIQDPVGETQVQEPFAQSGAQKLILEPFALQSFSQKREKPEMQEPEIEKEDNEDEEVPSKKPRLVRKRRLSNNITDNFQKEMMGLLRENSNLLRNDDVAFCLSLLPITKDFSIQQKLNFRIEVMKVIMKISKMSNQQDKKSESDSSVE